MMLNLATGSSALAVDVDMVVVTIRRPKSKKRRARATVHGKIPSNLLRSVLLY